MIWWGHDFQHPAAICLFNAEYPQFLLIFPPPNATNCAAVFLSVNDFLPGSLGQGLEIGGASAAAFANYLKGQFKQQKKLLSIVWGERRRRRGVLSKASRCGGCSAINLEEVKTPSRFQWFLLRTWAFSPPRAAVPTAAPRPPTPRWTCPKPWF